MRGKCKENRKSGIFETFYAELDVKIQYRSGIKNYINML